MGKLHVLVIPYPAQGHVIPLMELAQCLVKHDTKVTFVNTNFNHKRIMDSLSGNDIEGDLLNLVSIPDGLEPWEDRNNLGKLTEAIFRVMPQKLEDLIEKINRSDKDKITCIIADESSGWALDVAEKMRVKRAAFWPAPTALLALVLSVPQLISDKVIDNNGYPLQNQAIHLSPTMPAMSTAKLVWNCAGDSTVQKKVFETIKKNNASVKVADWVICNSSYDLEYAAFNLFPKLKPIGPLLASNRLGKPAGYFWPADSTCLDWLDQQPARSVIYVAFGSFTVFNQSQFQELALGLELTNKPFLWVVRPDITVDSDYGYPKGFKIRVENRGRMVDWAPQQQVLSHPSIACFISHCGWNSTMEGVSNGVPFLCWPYFCDQFLNETYICDVWKIGLGFEKNESGIITREEIKDKVERLLGDKIFKARALDLQEKASSSVREGGCSHKNLSDFIRWIKEDGNIGPFHVG